MSNEEKKKRSSFRFSVLSTTTTCSSTWNTTFEQLNSTYGSISQSRSSTTATTSAGGGGVGGVGIGGGGCPNTAAAAVATTTTASSSFPTISHQMVVSRGRYIGFKRCAHCRRFLMQWTVLRKQDTGEHVFSCDVCGIRVHERCMDSLTTSCVMTTQYVGGLVQSAVIRSNKKRWDPNATSTTTTTPGCSVSSPQSPVSFNTDNVNSAAMTSTTFGDSLLGSSIAFLSADDIDAELLEKDKLMTWEDVTIQPSELQFQGRAFEGRFGVVHHVHYHGDAVVKYVNMEYIHEKDRRVEAFKTEVVSAYKNSRHDNIALFLGYIVNPLTNTYAIVTNYYPNHSLHSLIHDDSSPDNIDASYIFKVSLHICQAMSYLHKKRIIHKDLRSKNVLLDNSGKVFVADFALMKLERLAVPTRNYSLQIPNHWLDYLAPEIAGNLCVESDEVVTGVDLPFSCESDVYAFGTIFFELLMRKLPTGSLPWEVKMYEKVIGTKASLSRIDALTQRIDAGLTELLMKCWQFKPSDRPTFPSVVKSLNALHESRKKSHSSRRSGAHENPLF